MTVFKAFKVTSLPAQLAPDALYFTLNGAFVELYATNSAGVAKMVGNSAMMANVADERISRALADLNMIDYAATLADRDAMVATAARNLLVFVQDATGDPTVGAGAALYFWRESNATWSKISEYEAMSVTLAWANITGRPDSPVSLIDDAVLLRHTHANSAVLALIGESGGQLSYNGQAVASAWGRADW